MAAKKKRRMTQHEKREMVKMREDLREKGLLPPVKAKLNRKKYIDEAEKLWQERPCGTFWEVYLNLAITWMMTHRGSDGKLSREAVAGAKIYRMALTLQKCVENKEDAGRLTIGEAYEAIKDILEE